MMEGHQRVKVDGTHYAALRSNTRAWHMNASNARSTDVLQWVNSLQFSCALAQSPTQTLRITAPCFEQGPVPPTLLCGVVCRPG